ncbi:Uncharacterised protein [Vibrio cholerae]|uniref:Uncharacterized protein n=1 Tax=Vibrio cholerae TaxID=666 RepID=A0A655XUW7_VIBCL|nr:Uncharacterised protein [Vibrio cholerae]
MRVELTLTFFLEFGIRMCFSCVCKTFSFSNCRLFSLSNLAISISFSFSLRSFSLCVSRSDSSFLSFSSNAISISLGTYLRGFYLNLCRSNRSLNSLVLLSFSDFINAAVIDLTIVTFHLNWERPESQWLVYCFS